MQRIKNNPAEIEIEWFGAPFESEELSKRRDASLSGRLRFLSGLEEDDLNRQVRFVPAPDEPAGVNSLRDVALQLDYHSIPRRARICPRLHEPGIEPPQVDYIHYVREK